MNIEEIRKRAIKFRDERNWKQFHNPKDLAISLSLEASELLENFQWKTSEEAIEKNIENIKEELADVLINSLMLSNEINADVEEIILKKLEKNSAKYPVDKAFGSNKKYNEL
jgi:NTP pyrophosphatase (non-canonical NTP hydrolase)